MLLGRRIKRYSDLKFHIGGEYTLFLYEIINPFG